MKKIYFLCILFIAAITFNGCYLLTAGPEIQLKNEFDGDGIAVLNFSVHGNYIPSDIGQIAADKFSDDLFISNSYNVIERARVNNAVKELEIKSTEILSEDDIQKLGIKLNSKFLVLGRIQQICKSDFYDSPKQLYLSFRIISIKDSDVVGVGTYEMDYDDNLVETVGSMISELVDKIEIE